MKIIEYSISSLVHIKSEITKLSPLQVENKSNNYSVVIPILISSVPDDIMFIAENMLIPPQSTGSYYPKFVKLGGTTFSNFIAPGKLSGITINLIVFD